MRRTLVTLVLMAGCASPSLRFTGIPAQRIDAGGMTFSVRLRDDTAEAMRISRAWLPREREVFQNATVAIERASGCTVDRVGGDQAIVRARLTCPAASP